MDYRESVCISSDDEFLDIGEGFNNIEDSEEEFNQ